jgi:rsbT co-antagonist protein RsbR
LPEFANSIAQVISRKEPEIMSRWLDNLASAARRSSGAEKQEVARESREFMHALRSASEKEQLEDINSAGWRVMRDLLGEISSRRAKGGYTPSETAAFVFSLKEPFFAAVQEELGNDPPAFLAAIRLLTSLIDRLGLYTMEVFQTTREEVISRQQQELLELSTPVVRLWDNILALPLIGTLDSARTQIVMQNLLDAIVQTRSDYAIIDITGVPVVDTLVAQHLLKTIAAARLMGADCLISGIRPQIAQTIIHLGVDLSEVTTKATLADAFAVALSRGGNQVVRREKKEKERARAAVAE